MLIDCGHSVEVIVLDKWVLLRKEHISLPLCPYCSQIIINTPRYSHETKATMKAINKIKAIEYGKNLMRKENLDTLTSKVNSISKCSLGKYIICIIKGYKSHSDA